MRNDSEDRRPDRNNGTWWEKNGTLRLLLGFRVLMNFDIRQYILRNVKL